MNSGIAVSASLKLWIVSATSAIEPDRTMTTSCKIEVTRSATKEISTARIPRRDDSSAVSIESAASWLFEMCDRGVEQEPDVFVGEVVVDEATVAPRLHDAVRAQESKRVRDRGLADPRAAREVADTRLVGLRELNQDPQPGAVGQHPEKVGHHREVLVAVGVAAVAMDDVSRWGSARASGAGSHTSIISEQSNRC